MLALRFKSSFFFFFQDVRCHVTESCRPPDWYFWNCSASNQLVRVVNSYEPGNKCEDPCGGLGRAAGWLVSGGRRWDLQRVGRDRASPRCGSGLPPGLQCPADAQRACNCAVIAFKPRLSTPASKNSEGSVGTHRNPNCECYPGF